MWSFNENRDIGEIKMPQIENFKAIKPENGMSVGEARSYWNDTFRGEQKEKTSSAVEDKNGKAHSFERVLPEINKSKDVKPEDGMTFNDSQKYWDHIFASDVEENDYFSTYDERLKQTPKEDGDRGGWEGKRGESKFIPNDPDIKAIIEKYGLDGIVYKDGIPDFSNVSESTVEIDNMTENRAENFKQCDENCAEQWNKDTRDGRTDWLARDVAQWRKDNGYSWHERNDMKTCDLIPTKINDYFGHLGGVSECKKRDAANDGGDFDE